MQARHASVAPDALIRIGGRLPADRLESLFHSSPSHRDHAILLAGRARRS